MPRNWWRDGDTPKPVTSSLDDLAAEQCAKDPEFREAWERAEALWALGEQPDPAKLYETALDDLVAVVGRCLLLPVGL